MKQRRGTNMQCWQPAAAQLAGVLLLLCPLQHVKYTVVQNHDSPLVDHVLQNQLMQQCPLLVLHTCGCSLLLLAGAISNVRGGP
jgi:hypothetical protein